LKLMDRASWIKVEQTIHVASISYTLGMNAESRSILSVRMKDKQNNRCSLVTKASKENKDRYY